MSVIQDQRRQYGRHFQYAEDKKLLASLLEEVRLLRKRIKKYEERFTR